METDEQLALGTSSAAYVSINEQTDQLLLMAIITLRYSGILIGCVNLGWVLYLESMLGIKPNGVFTEHWLP